MNKTLFEEASIEELALGYTFAASSETFHCLFCTAFFEEGVIYQEHGKLLEAKKAIKVHIQAIHGSSMDALLQLEKKQTGLSDQQKELITAFAKNLSDKEVANRLGISVSTVRNHRFKLREKEKQAKVFLAMMQRLQIKEEDNLVNIHEGAKMVDERYVTTEAEKEKILRTYFKDGLGGQLSLFPSKEKRKIIVLQQLLLDFEKGKKYTEQEVSEILKQRYDDFATLRRYFIEYGFMDRSKDGLQYWLK